MRSTVAIDSEFGLSIILWMYGMKLYNLTRKAPKHTLTAS
jgi:hypothetical protein